MIIQILEYEKCNHSFGKVEYFHENLISKPNLKEGYFNPLIPSYKNFKLLSRGTF